MVGNKGSPTTGLSWADEVEKEEEEEAAREQLHQHQKPNPFGSARPREVILEEKGIDWRKFDKKLHEPSNPSLKKEKQLKENIPAPTDPIRGTQPYPQRSREFDRNIKTTTNGCDRSGIRSVCRQTLQNRNLDRSAPPLRYPPKNTIGLMKEMQWSKNPCSVEVDRPNFREFHIERERENMDRELRMKWYLNSNRLDFSFRGQYNRHIDLHELEIERGRENTIRDNRGAHYVRTSPVHGEKDWDNMNSMFERRTVFEERFLGPPPLVNRRSSVLTNHEIGWRSADEEINWENIQDEYETRNCDYKYGRRRFDVQEFMGPLIGAVGHRAIAEAHQNADIESMGHGKNNNRKRGIMKSGTSSSHYHQREKKMNSKKSKLCF